LIGEILTQCSYIDSAKQDPIEYVGLSIECYDKVLEEAVEETGKEDITPAELEDLLKVKCIIMPGLFSVDYRFLKEIRP
jgi:hypothetical protein